MVKKLKRNATNFKDKIIERPKPESSDDESDQEEEEVTMLFLIILFKK